MTQSGEIYTTRVENYVVHPVTTNHWNYPSGPGVLLASIFCPPVILCFAFWSGVVWTQHCVTDVFWPLFRHKIHLRVHRDKQLSDPTVPRHRPQCTTQPSRDQEQIQPLVSTDSLCDYIDSELTGFINSGRCDFRDDELYINVLSRFAEKAAI